MVGDGSQTELRFALSWVIVVFIALITTLYLVFSVFELILFVLWKCRGIDYKQQWIDELNTKSNSDKDSESMSAGSMKETQSQTNKKKLTQNLRERTFQKSKDWPR